MDCKQAIEEAHQWGYARYDLNPHWDGSEGSVWAAHKGETYQVGGTIDGVRVDAECSEAGLNQTLGELNVRSEAGWYSL